MLFSKKILCFYLCIGMALIPFLASDRLFAKKKAATKIVHSPIKYFVPGSRISINAKVTDPAGIMLVSPVLNLGGNLGDMLRIARDHRRGAEVRLEASDQDRWLAWRNMFSWVIANTPGPGSRLIGPEVLPYFVADNAHC